MMLIGSLSLAHAQGSEFTLSCDTGGVRRTDCIELLNRSVSSLGCSIQGISCKTHPWGSDFIKSWVCSGKSTNCQNVPSSGCPAGTISVFKDDWNVCLKTTTKVDAFQGDCRHAQASHPIAMKSCDEKQFSCAEFGGSPEGLSVRCKTNALGSSQNVSGPPDCGSLKDQCAKLGGEVFGNWELTCRFRDIVVPVQGPSCDTLREDCERENSLKGTESKLLSCLPRL